MQSFSNCDPSKSQSRYVPYRSTWSPDKRGQEECCIPFSSLCKSCILSSNTTLQSRMLILRTYSYDSDRDKLWGKPRKRKGKAKGTESAITCLCGFSCHSLQLVFQQPACKYTEGKWSELDAQQKCNYGRKQRRLLKVNLSPNHSPKLHLSHPGVNEVCYKVA